MHLIPPNCRTGGGIPCLVLRSVFFLCALFIVPMVSADIPMMINYQGRVTDSAGDPVTDGNYNMWFRIYDAPKGGDML